MQQPIFSKAPLKEVIFEIRFSPNISAACKKDDFYNEINKEYPEVFFPKLNFEQHPFAQPVQYISQDKTKRITCSSESLSFSTTKYEGFTVFKGECIKLIGLFFEKYPSICRIKRIGFRYINQILVVRKNDKINLEDYLKFNFILPASLSQHKLEFFQTTFFIEVEANASGVRVAINSLKDNENKEFIVLDFDLICLKEIDHKEVEQYLTAYHNKIEEIFLDIMSEKYKDSIK